MSGGEKLFNFIKVSNNLKMDFFTFNQKAKGQRTLVILFNAKISIP